MTPRAAAFPCSGGRRQARKGPTRPVPCIEFGIRPKLAATELIRLWKILCRIISPSKQGHAADVIACRDLLNRDVLGHGSIPCLVDHSTTHTNPLDPSKRTSEKVMFKALLLFFQSVKHHANRLWFHFKSSTNSFVGLLLCCIRLPHFYFKH